MQGKNRAADAENVPVVTAGGRNWGTSGERINSIDIYIHTLPCVK